MPLLDKKPNRYERYKQAEKNQHTSLLELSKKDLQTTQKRRDIKLREKQDMEK